MPFRNFSMPLKRYDTATRLFYCFEILASAAKYASFVQGSGAPHTDNKTLRKLSIAYQLHTLMKIDERRTLPNEKGSYHLALRK